MRIQRLSIACMILVTWTSLQGCALAEAISGGSDSADSSGASGVDPNLRTFSFRVGGTGSAAMAAARARAPVGQQISVISPEGDEYEGMGVDAGDAIVEGLKIRLTAITLGTIQPGMTGAVAVKLFDWSAEPKELELTESSGDLIEEEITASLTEGDYTYVKVEHETSIGLKAYAYLDRDDDGEIDATVFTTVDGAVQVDSIIAAAGLAAEGYDYMSLDSGETEKIVVFLTPLVIEEGGTGYSSRLLLDSTRIARVSGDPQFAVTGLPMFVTQASGELTSQSYLVSRESTFGPFSNVAFTLLFDADGEPLSGAFSRNGNDLGPFLGNIARAFDKQEDGSYHFYVDYGTTTLDGVEDGGLFYNNDRDMAGFAVSGFVVQSVGDVSVLTVTDGLRCSAGLNLCAASADNDLNIGGAVEGGTRTLYLKRVR